MVARYSGPSPSDLIDCQSGVEYRDGALTAICGTRARHAVTYIAWDHVSASISALTSSRQSLACRPVVAGYRLARSD